MGVKELCPHRSQYSDGEYYNRNLQVIISCLLMSYFRSCFKRIHYSLIMQDFVVNDCGVVKTKVVFLVNMKYIFANLKKYSGRKWYSKGEKNNTKQNTNKTGRYVLICIMKQNSDCMMVLSHSSLTLLKILNKVHIIKGLSGKSSICTPLVYVYKKHFITLFSPF